MIPDRNPDDDTIKHVNIFHSFRYHIYRPKTKLREGNVFSRVCLSFCSEELPPIQGPCPPTPTMQRPPNPVQYVAHTVGSGRLASTEMQTHTFKESVIRQLLPLYQKIIRYIPLLFNAIKYMLLRPLWTFVVHQN